MNTSGKDPKSDGSLIGMIAASPAHVLAASPLLRLIAVLGALLGTILLVGGVYLAFAGGMANTKFNLFGK